MFNPYNQAEITDKAPCQTTCCGSSTSSATVMCCEPIRVGSLPRPNGELSKSQSGQIYSIEGKATTQMAGGGGAGAKTGLYAIPVNTTPDEKSQTIKSQYCKNSVANFCCYSSTYGATGVAEPLVFATATEWDENGKPTKAISCADGKTYTVYEVKDGQITIKDKQYPIKLADGYYIIRKLTVRECARLQTMPDDYCKAVSDSQAYKALGNGWTAEVIIHLLNHALKDVPRDEEIVVLSLSMTESQRADTVSTKWDLPMLLITHTKSTSTPFRWLWITTPKLFNTEMRLQFVRMIGKHHRLAQSGWMRC